MAPLAVRRGALSVSMMRSRDKCNRHHREGGPQSPTTLLLCSLLTSMKSPPQSEAWFRGTLPTGPGWTPDAGRPDSPTLGPCWQPQLERMAS